MAFTCPDVAKVSKRWVSNTGIDAAAASFVPGAEPSPNVARNVSAASPSLVARNANRTSVGDDPSDGSVMLLGPSMLSGLSAGRSRVTVAGPEVPERFWTTAPASNRSPIDTKRGSAGRTWKGVEIRSSESSEPNRSAPLVATAITRYAVRDWGSFSGTVASPSSPTFTEADQAARIRKSVRTPLPLSSSPPPPPGSGENAGAASPLSASANSSRPTRTRRIRLSLVLTSRLR